WGLPYRDRKRPRRGNADPARSVRHIGQDRPSASESWHSPRRRGRSRPGLVRARPTSRTTTTIQSSARPKRASCPGPLGRAAPPRIYVRETCRRRRVHASGCPTSPTRARTATRASAFIPGPRMQHAESGFLTLGLVLLAAAVLSVPIARKLGLSAIVA